MNLIDEVAKLKMAMEEVGEALPLRLDEHGQLWDNELSLIDTIVPSSDHKIRVDLHNAAPKLLAVLSGFQAGDVKLLDGIIRYLIEDFVEGEHSCQMVAWLMTHSEDTSKDMIDLLRRYHDMAQVMEAHR